MSAFFISPNILGAGLARLAITGAVCALVVFLFHRLLPVSSELSRKLLHASVLAMTTVWLYAFPTWQNAVTPMVVFVIVVYPLLCFLEKRPALFALLKRAAAERRPGELRLSLCAAGSMFILLCVICWGALGSRPLALACLYAWGPGDAAAALIGKRYGKTPIGRQNKKTMEGSLAMFGCALVSVTLILAVCGEYSPETAIFPAALAALAATLAELFTLNGMDTFFCPVSAMIVFVILRLLPF